jgi:hypothetical protein
MARACAGSGAFEALEARVLLAGVTAQLQYASTDASSLYFYVRYESDRPIDLASLDGDELRVVKQGGGYAQGAELVNFNRYGENGAVARYRVGSPAPAWNFTDNGRYDVELFEGTVANNAGETNEAALVHTFGLWFASPRVVLAGTGAIDVYGMGYTGLPDGSGRVSVFDEARVDVRYETHSLDIDTRMLTGVLTGPEGYVRTVTLVPQVSQFGARAGGGYEAVLSFRFEAPGQTWDALDAGEYVFTLTLQPPLLNHTGLPSPIPPPPPVLIEHTFEVSPRGVTAEMDVSVSPGGMLITMNYSHPSGIDLASVGAGDIKVSVPGHGLLTAAMVGLPLVLHDGSVVARYRIAEPVSGWGAVAGGNVFVRSGLQEVRAGSGEVLGFAKSRLVNVASGGLVTATVKSAYTTAGKLVVVVRYTGDQPIDAASLGGDDLRLTGPMGYAQNGSLVQMVPESGTTLLAVYHFLPNGLTWDFRTDNGSYTLTFLEGSVREAGENGDSNAQANIRTFGLWFQTPAVQVMEAPHAWTGTAVPDNQYDNTDAARVVLRYVTAEYRTHHVRNHGLFARLTGPNGLVVSEQLVNYWRPSYRSQGYGDNTVVDLRFAAPGGGWDAADNGVYTITVLLRGGPGSGIAGQPVTEALFTQQFTVNVSSPRVEHVSTVTSSSAMAVTVRYSDPQGVDVSSLDGSDVTLELSFRDFIFSYTSSVSGTLVGGPAVGADGSVTATYRFQSPSGVWVQQNATLMVRPGEVRDGAANPVGAPLVQVLTIPAGQPDVVGVGTIAVARTAWDVEVILRNPGGLIDTSTIRPGNLIVQAPDGRATRVSVVSVTTSLDGTLRARYRIMPPIGQLRLFNGEYTLALAGNSISQGVVGYLPAAALGTFNMTFP